MSVTSTEIVYLDRNMYQRKERLDCEVKYALTCPKCKTVFGCETLGINYKIYKYCDETCQDYLNGLCEVDTLPEKVATFPCISCANINEYD